MTLAKLLHAFWRRPVRRPATRGDAAPRGVAPESRVGPRASAWVAGRWETGLYESTAAGAYPALTLDYGLYLPPDAAAPTAQAERGPALVVMLHGCRQSGEAFARGTRMNLLADRHGFAVLYPDQTTQRHAHACWHWYDPGPLAGGGEARAISGLIEQVVGTRGFDPARVYLAGLSAGAGMATALAMHYPRQFAALATHSGPVYGAARSVTSALDVMRRGAAGDPLEALQALRAGGAGQAGRTDMPALLLHGARDGVVDPVNLAQLRLQMLAVNGMLAAESAAGADLRLAAGSDCVTTTGPGAAQLQSYRRAGRCLVRTCLVPDLEHAWSGGDDAVPFHAAIGPDASELAWSFFSAHSRPQAELRGPTALADTV